MPGRNAGPVAANIAQRAPTSRGHPAVLRPADATTAQLGRLVPEGAASATRAVIDGPLERILDKCRCGHALREAPERALMERSWRWSTSTGPSPTPRRIRWVLHRWDTRRPAVLRVFGRDACHPRS